MDIKSIAIGIQARSTSERFPGKINELVGGKPVLQHIIDSAKQSARYLNKNTNRSGIMVNVALLIPENDPIKNSFRGVPIIEGDEFDVLSRYKKMADKFFADYVVRVTGDCVLLPSKLITVHVNRCVHNKKDYVSNVWEGLRTFPDGHDVEIMSRRVLDWLDENADNPKDREHVTTFLRHENPSFFEIGHIFHDLNLSEIKLSIDTKEDLENARKQFESLRELHSRAESQHGRYSLFRF